MTPEQFQQIEALFHRGKDLPREEQRALLDADCGDEGEVRAEVEKLLANADPEETLAALRGEVAEVLRPGVNDPSAATAGPVIEGYEILREIHRGGQGVVYQAIQKSTKRKVAIKVLLEGPYASKSARRRFEREIELVAQLKHPNIVGIFHSGQTSDARQYCVMDYVRGVPLDQYVRNEKLTLEDALKLFAKVCEAVNYAHQKGVIHRDLKPSNILVTPPLSEGGPGGVGGVGEPKVLDFGLAKQLISREASLISLTGQVVGTLPYMSPEQAEGNPDKIDIRTDVYALGVILYQMLTGHYPYPVAGQMAEVLKHIAETPPTPPSHSWKSGSGVTKRSHKRIRPGQCPIDDEVQTIVLRTLAKERERRYQSAGELAKDVAHYLADEPIDAKRDSGWYVIRKNLRRYRVPIATAAAFALLVIGAAVVSTALYLQAEEQRRIAQDAAKVAAGQRHLAQQAQLEAGAERDRAQSAETLARRQAYLANLSAAAGALAQGNMGTLRRQLDAAPSELRGWEWRYLNAAADHSLAVLHGHEGDVWSVAFSPDGDSLVSGGRDGTVRVWDAINGDELAVLRGHKGDVWSVAYSPDGTRIASASSDGTLRMWDATTGKELVALVGHEGDVTSVAFSPDGTRLASASYDETVRIWNSVSGVSELVLRGHTYRVRSVAFSPDGTRLVSSSGDATIRVWDASNGGELTVLRGHGGNVWSVAFSPDGTRIASGSSDRAVKVWDAATGANTLTLRGHERTVFSVSFSPEGKRLASVGLWTVRLWDVAAGDERAHLRGHTRSLSSVTFSPDGSRLASSSRDGTIRIWATVDADGLAVLRGHVRGKGRGSDLLFSGENWVSAVAFNADGSRLASAGYDGTVRLWDPDLGEQLVTLRGHTGWVECVAFSPDGAILASASSDKTIRLWSSLTGGELLVLRGHERTVHSVAFSPNGQLVASGGHDHTARIWDRASGVELATLLHPEWRVLGVVFSPDGTRLATVSDDSIVRLWDASTGKLVEALSGHTDEVLAVAYDAEGTRLASASRDGTVRIWDALTGEGQLVLREHGDGVQGVAFSPDGARLATAGYDKTVRIWDTTTGEELVSLQGHLDRVSSVAFSADGTRLASASRDLTVRLWDEVPLAVRYQSYQELMAAREPAGRLVDALWQQLQDARTVAERVRKDPTLREPIRHAALNEILRRAVAGKD